MRPWKELKHTSERLLDLCFNLCDFEVEDVVVIDDDEEGEENKSENEGREGDVNMDNDMQYEGAVVPAEGGQ
eukprot:12170304-Ditylum_brightwellii.AAC.1